MQHVIIINYKNLHFLKDNQSNWINITSLDFIFGYYHFDDFRTF